MPRLYVIAGPNGAGKTTASYSILPEMLNCKEFVNADEIARGLSPFNPESVSIPAGRLMLQRMNMLLADGVDFAFETTLATRSYVNFIARAHAKGYSVVLLFFWLPTTEQAIARVESRVRQGGHNIPNDVIVRRFAHGLKNLIQLYIPVCDYWAIYDNSSTDSRVDMVAYGQYDTTKTIIDTLSYKKIEHYGRY